MSNDRLSIDVNGMIPLSTKMYRAAVVCFIGCSVLRGILAFVDVPLSFGLSSFHQLYGTIRPVHFSEPMKCFLKPFIEDHVDEWLQQG